MKNKFTSTIILFMTMAIFAPFVRAQCPGNQIGVNFSITNYDQGISALFPDATINYLIVSSSNVVVSSGSLSSGQDLDLDLCLDQGCYTVTVTGMACEFSGCSFFPTCDNWLMTAGTTELDGSSGISNSTTHTVCVISGCTDIDACNYNQIASIDDGSCTGTKGCTDPLACNFQAWASCESGACCYDNTCFEFTLTSLNGLSLDLMGWKVIGNGSLTRVGRGPASTTATDHLCIVPAIYSIQIIDNNGAEVDIELGDLAGGEILYESNNYIEFAYGMNVGCQNPEACNYDPLAEISVECKFPGCTDPSACNYSENAGCDDGSCITEGMQTVHISASNGTGLTIFDDQGNEIDSFNFFIGASMDICLPFGCYSLNGSIGNCITGFGITLCKSITVSVNGIELAHLVLGNNNADICIEHGCLDPLACNFDPEATLADGSCLYTTGCTDPSKSNYDPLALCDDGSCIGGIFGCTDPVACNYKPLATQDDGSCDITSTKVHINIQNFNTGAANPIVLVMDGPQGPLLNISVPVGQAYEDDVCLPLGCLLYSVTGLGLNDIAELETNATVNPLVSGSSSYCLIDGCTDPMACNYHPYNTVDDGSCCNSSTCVAISLFDGGSETLNGALMKIFDSSNNLVVVRTVYSVDEWFESACLSDGCYSLEVLPGGAGNPITIDVFNGAGTSSGTSLAPITFTVGGTFGCTDPTACNFNPQAVCDDATCNYGSPLIVRVTNAPASGATVIFSFREVFNGPIIGEGTAFPSASLQEFEICLPEQCLLFSISGLGSGDSYQIGTIQNGNFVALTGTLNGGTFNLSQSSVCFIYGCTQMSSCNPQNSATVDDGSCLTDCDYCISLSMFDDGSESLYNTVFRLYQGTTLIQEQQAYQIDEFFSGLCIQQDGCYTFEVVDNGENAGVDWELLEGNSLNFVLSGTGPGKYGLAIFGTVGCTDEQASNYDVNADCDDGSCQYAGCTDPEACNFNPDATLDDGSCLAGIPATLTLSNSPLSSSVIGITFINEFGEGLVYLQDVEIGITSQSFCLPHGCNEFNFSGIGTGDTFSIETDPEAYALYSSSYSGNQFFNVCVSGEGCTDVAACNFNPAALTDDGTCHYMPIAMQTGNGPNGPEIEIALVDAQGNVLATSITNNNQVEFSGACLSPGCFEVHIQGMDADDASDLLDQINIVLNGNELFGGILNSNGGYAFCLEAGCNDHNACNFNPNAYFDDGTCLYNAFGCSDPIACNYQEGQFCQENCIYTSNAEFTIVNGNLANAITYLIHDPEQGIVVAQGTTTTGLTLPLCLGPGCYFVQVSGMQISSPIALDFWQLEIGGNVVASGTGQNPNDNFCVESGCTDPASCNYNPSAIFDNGSCDEVLGLIFIFNYGGNTSGKPASFSLNHASGSMNESFGFEGQPVGQYTYTVCVPMDCYTVNAAFFESNDLLIVTDFEGNVLVNISGPTLARAYVLCPGLGCTDIAACNYDALAIIDDGSCKFGVTGCIDLTACNYNPAAVCADDSCVYPGCNDPLACNYDPLAGCNDGSCLLEVVLHINNFNPPVVTYNLFHPTTFVQYMNGNTPPNTNFTDIVACIPDECLTLDIHGLTGSDSWTLSIGSAVIASGNMDGIFAVCQHDGCTDLAACNYDPAAVHDNGTCFYLSGDFDGNHVINTSDLLLFMAAFGCGSNCGIYDLDGNGVVNTSDLLLFMSFFGTSC